MTLFGDDWFFRYWGMAPGSLGAIISGCPHFGEGHRGYISLNIVSEYKSKKNSSSIFHGHGTYIFDPTNTSIIDIAGSSMCIIIYFKLIFY